MPTSSLHKLVFAPSLDEMDKLIREEARSGWHPSKFAPQPVRDGVLVVFEKQVLEVPRARAS